MLPANRNDIQSTYTIHPAERSVRQLIDEVTHNARDALAVLERQIREHPVKAGAIAMSVGLLLGMASRR